jgi:hypothetical protein
MFANEMFRMNVRVDRECISASLSQVDVCACVAAVDWRVYEKSRDVLVGTARRAIE